MDAVLFSSANTEHGTPLDLFEVLHKEFAFTLDAAASEENRVLSRWLEGPCIATHRDPACPCGLCADWMENVVFVNPPYGKNLSYTWVKKCWASARQGATVVALLPARTDTGWFHNFVLRADEVRFITGRLKFRGNEDAAPFPSMIVVWRPPRPGRQLPPAFHSSTKLGEIIGG